MNLYRRLIVYKLVDRFGSDDGDVIRAELYSRALIFLRFFSFVFTIIVRSV